MTKNTAMLSKNSHYIFNRISKVCLLLAFVGVANGCTVVGFLMGQAVDESLEDDAYSVKYAKKGLEADVELIKTVIDSFKKED